MLVRVCPCFGGILLMLIHLYFLCDSRFLMFQASFSLNASFVIELRAWFSAGLFGFNEGAGVIL